MEESGEVIKGANTEPTRKLQARTSNVKKEDHHYTQVQFIFYIFITMENLTNSSFPVSY